MENDDDILLSTLECAEARDVTPQHCKRERCVGNGPPYLKDSRTGTIWYPWSGLVRWCEKNNRRLRWPGEQRA